LKTLDGIDKKILKVLQQEGNIANQDLAERVSLSPSPCSRRVKSLEERGFITRYAALLNPSKLQLKLTAMISVELKSHETGVIENFEKSILCIPEVVQCYLLAGQTADYFLKVVATDLDEYRSFLLNKLTKIPEVKSIQSSFILKSVVDKTELPLSHV
jgi:Lrp/AsnC family leucine-responsive transcriptional regulator